MGAGLVPESSAGAGVPAANQQMYFRPVSCTLQCVMALTVVSLGIYTSLSVARNVDELSGEFKPSLITQTLNVASRTATLMPMLCMLFVGCRMFVLATTKGLGEPPDWVKGCMRGAVGGIFVQVLIIMALPACTSHAAEEEASYDMTEGKAKIAQEVAAVASAEEPESEPKGFGELAGEQNDAHPVLHTLTYKEGMSSLKPLFWSAQMLSMVFVYGGVAGIITGIFTFPSQATKISPAVLCTIWLTLVYFFVYLLLWIGRTLPESDQQAKLLRAALSMSSVVRKAPMFSVLFLMSRMRALNLDPPYGMPPPWMQACFVGITLFVYLEVVAAAAVGASGRQTKAYYGVYIYHCESSLPHIAQHACAFVTYLALAPICVGVFLMKDQAGQYAPLSTTMNCVLIFEIAYFGVMLGQTVTLCMMDVMKTEMTMLRDTFVAAGISLGLAPMLCILFVATRMRALQITQQKGAPPGWAQDCMMIAVFATCIQSLCCILMPIFIGSACKVDDDGNPDYDLKPMIGAYAVTVVKYVALISLHGSVICICVAVFVMTPETAHSGDRFINSTRALFEGLAVTMFIFALALLFSSAKVIGMAVKFAIESADKAFLGVDITIQSAALSICKGYVNISKLVVHQPEEEILYERDEAGKMVGKPTGKMLEWKEDYIVKVKSLLVKINLWRLVTSLGKEFELENLTLLGVHMNIEKPNTNLKQPNSNVEYIINFIDSLGLIPAAEAEDKASVKKEVAPPPAAEKQPAEKKPAAAPASDMPTIILRKIAFGDIGAGVTVKNVPVIGQLSFHPTIGVIAFDDIQRDIFGGREDLAPAETIACIFKAFAKKVFAIVVLDIPRQLAGSSGDAAKAMAQNVAAGLGSMGRMLSSKMAGCVTAPAASMGSSPSRTEVK